MRQLHSWHTAQMSMPQRHARKTSHRCTRLRNVDMHTLCSCFCKPARRWMPYPRKTARAARRRRWVLLRCMRGYVDVARVLLDGGANVMLRDRDEGDYTSLHYAVMQGKTDVVKLLLQRGADPNQHKA